MSLAPARIALISPAVLAAVARRSAGLGQRLRDASGTPHADVMGAAPETEPGGRAARWRAEAAGGDEALFHKRLAWDGLTPETAGSLLSDEWPLTTEPQWLDFLESLLCCASPSPWSDVIDAAVAQSGAPFAAAYRPFLASALPLAHGRPAKVLAQINEAVHGQSAAALLRQLARLGAPALARCFAEYRQEHGAPATAGSSACHDAFVAGLIRDGGWERVLAGHPALARLLAVVSVGWAEETRTFWARLEKDWEEIGRFFFADASQGAPLVLESIRADVSDRHGGAGMVRMLEFSAGRKLVYKRRPLALEADFHHLLRDAAAQGLECAPPALRVLPKAGYGWVEHAHAAPVADAEALEKWFRRAGGLLCLMHVLGGTDGHMENIIATAEGPVLIDVETLLQPRLSPPEKGQAGTFALAARRAQDSVWQTGLLPLWQKGRQGSFYDIGGLTGEGGYESPAARLVWENTGTDAIEAVWRRGVARPLANLPLFAGERRSAARHLPALCAGFAETWRFLREKTGLLEQALGAWADAPLRVLLRPTSHYAALLEASLSLEALRSGLDRSLPFEALRRAFVRGHQERPALWPAVESEIAALEDGDIPIFFVRAGGHDLESLDGRVAATGVFRESALQAVHGRLAAMTEEELQRQLEMIASAFIPPVSTRAVPAAEAPQAAVDYEALLAATPLISDQGLINAATVLGRQIMGAAIRGRDGFVTWMAPAFLQPDQREQKGVSYYLYDGAAGIALFLAALAKVTGDDRARSTALAALAPVRAILDSPNAADMVRHEGIGGCSGLGSLVYALTAVSRLLDLPEMLALATRVSALIDDERIARDQALDVVGGSAGAIFGLLALHRATGSSDVLRRAESCGRHLLHVAEKVGDDALAWPSWPDRLLLAGYSHGTAGIAAALHALFLAGGDEAFAEAAWAALRYERSLFDATAGPSGNWPMLVPGGESRAVSTWCHGAPGILLSRLGFMGKLGEAEDGMLRGEIQAAARATLAPGLSGVDHLCCGTMGRVEILHTAAPVLGGKARDLARLGATLTIRRAQQRKAFSLQEDTVRNAVFQPGFFRGSSGLGHAFLRLARPDLVPSALAWEI